MDSEKEKKYKVPPVVIYIIMLLLVLLIAAPPILRLVLKGTDEPEVVIPKDKVEALMCNKNVMSQTYSTTRVVNNYTNEHLTKLTITYQHGSGSAPASVGLTPEQEIAAFQAIAPLSIAIEESSTKITLTEKELTDLAGQEILTSYNHNATEQKQIFESTGYTCQIITP